MKNKLSSALKYLLFLSIGIGLLILAFKGQDIKKIYNEIKQANYFWIALSLAVSFFAYLSRAYRWNMLIAPLGYKPKLKNSFYSLMVGYLANLAIPRIGEVSRCASLSEAEKIPFTVLIGTVIIERIIDVVTLLLFILLLGITKFDLFEHFILDKIIHPVYDKLIIHSQLLILVGIAAILVLIVSWIYIRKNKIGSNSIYNRLNRFLIDIVQGIKTVMRMKNNLAFLAHTLFIWSMYFLTTYLCFFSIDATSNLGVNAGLFTLVIGAIAMSAPVQGGFGTYHLFTSQGLTLFGVSQTHGLIYATIVHSSQTLFAILLGGISFFLLLLLAKKNIQNVKP